MKCSQCAIENFEGARFCMRCGILPGPAITFGILLPLIQGGPPLIEMDLPPLHPPHFLA